jgi:regulatory LuxR family protein
LTTTEACSSRLTVTEREAEVLLWIARGKSNRDIAKILDLSPRTVNKHLELWKTAPPPLRWLFEQLATDATPILVGRCEPNTTEQNFRFVLSKFASRERLAPIQNLYCNWTFRLNPYPTKTGNFERCLTGEDSLTAGNSGAS